MALAEIKKMNLSWNDRPFEFFPVTMQFGSEVYSDVFRQKNNKTLRQTLTHRRYTALAEETHRQYSHFLDTPIGVFLLTLKTVSDQYYLRFLNKYGDLTYSKFGLENESVLASKGLYLYLVHDEVRYIGRCKDSFKKRINQGYGTIHPKNCFIDGQATNCHINSMVTQNRHEISFLVCPLIDLQMIIEAEAGLISQCRPPWNIQGVNKSLTIS
jgi:hypothetical protein